MREQLAQLLKQAEEAHAASGDPAANWPRWYADYLVDRGLVATVPGPPLASRAQPMALGDY